MANFLGIPLNPLKLRSRQWKLYIRFCWYKYIHRLDIIGFFGGVPIIRSNHLVEESKSESPKTEILILQGGNMVEMCYFYTTTGYPNFRPKCLFDSSFWASLRCHSKNNCPAYVVVVDEFAFYPNDETMRKISNFSGNENSH